jgi:predicted nucleotidyltransferase
LSHINIRFHGSWYICTVDALCEMGELTLNDSLGIFLSFMEGERHIPQTSFEVHNDFLQISVHRRRCKVIQITDDIRKQINIKAEEDVYKIKLVGYMPGDNSIWVRDDSSPPFSWPALIYCYDRDENLLRSIECDRTDMRKKLRLLITFQPSTQTPSNSSHNAVTPSENVVLDMGDVYSIFVGFMRNLLSGKVPDALLKFGYTVESMGARRHRRITLEDEILLNIRIGRLRRIRYILLFGCEDGAVIKPASIHFLNRGNADVWSIAGNRSTLLFKLDQLIKFEITKSEPAEPRPDPTPKEYIAQLDLIIQACTTHPESHINPEFGEVIQICNEIKSKH